ncbi:MAG: D-tyrosyl-tRNA(Tyr) deacylase [Lachnospiraceae bacterium]|nr:D-tyrosyl-tRNA(Tyr) deacylase [Lachnospiraceae bacterium]
MRLVIQRVREASVTIDGKMAGQIGKGFLVLWGAKEGDTRKEADYLAAKLCRLRVFEDEAGKMNLSMSDVGGGLLVVSQFTLYADCRKGNRPNFMAAMRPEESEPLYEYFLEQCEKEVPVVERGEFGADMKVSLVNDGPVTILMDTEEMCG